MSKNLSKYDIVVVTKNDDGEEEVHIFKRKWMATVEDVMKAMENDRVFSLNDEEMRIFFFKPNEVSKLQFNLVESLGR